MTSQKSGNEYNFLLSDTKAKAAYLEGPKLLNWKDWTNLYLQANQNAR